MGLVQLPSRSIKTTFWLQNGHVKSSLWLGFIMGLSLDAMTDWANLCPFEHVEQRHLQAQFILCKSITILYMHKMVLHSLLQFPFLGSCDQSGRNLKVVMCSSSFSKPSLNLAKLSSLSIASMIVLIPRRTLWKRGQFKCAWVGCKPPKV